MDWNSCGFNGEYNPFHMENWNKKLLITIDDKNLVDANAREKDALETLFELSDHELLDIYVVSNPNFPQLKIADGINSHSKRCDQHNLFEEVQ